MSVALVLHPEGAITELDLSSDSLKAMRQAIGCDRVDVVALTSHLDMWIDDEGIYTQKHNPAATALARRFGFVWQDYYGPVVLCGVDSDANSINLTRDRLLGLLKSLADVAEEI